MSVANKVVLTYGTLDLFHLGYVRLCAAIEAA